MSAGVCLVTGTTGYVGGRLRARFESGGWQVLESRARLGEPVDPAPLRAADALVHCAWDFRDPSASVAGSVALFEAARDQGISEIVFVSSISAFERARSRYGQAKLAVEEAAARLDALVVRPGLVWGDPPGSMFGRLVDAVERAPLVPLLAGGRPVQFLVHEADLAELLFGWTAGALPRPGRPVAAAHHRPWTLRQIAEEIARARGREPRFVPVPAGVGWAALRLAEVLRLPVQLRSDSVVSLVNQDPAPPLPDETELGITFRPFGLTV